MLSNSSTTPIRSFCFLYEGAFLAAATKDGTILLFHASDSFVFVGCFNSQIRSDYQVPHPLRLNHLPSSSSCSTAFLSLFQSSKLLAIAGCNSKIQLWDISSLMSPNPTCSCRTTLQGHAGDVTTLAVLSDSLLLSGGRDHSIRIWDITAGKFVRCVNDQTFPM